VVIFYNSQLGERAGKQLILKFSLKCIDMIVKLSIETPIPSFYKYMMPTPPACIWYPTFKCMVPATLQNSFSLTFQDKTNQNWSEIPMSIFNCLRSH